MFLFNVQVPSDTWTANKQRYLLGGRKGMFFMFLCSKVVHVDTAWEYHSCWQYDTLSMKVSHSQQKSMILLACAESITLRVSYSQHVALRLLLHAESMTLSVQVESMMILLAHADTLSVLLSMCWKYHTLSAAGWGARCEYQRVLRVSYWQCHTLSMHWEHHSCWEYDTHMLRVSYSQRLTPAATKKTTRGNCQYHILTTLVNSVSTAPPIGLPPKEAKFCHNLNILLVGHQRCRALLQLYFNSSAVGWLVVSWTVVSP